jgi:hypothetical protein
VQLRSSVRTRLKRACRTRGMTIKTVLSRLVTWFVELDRVEQATVLRQIAQEDGLLSAELLLRQRRRSQRKR